MGFKRLEGISCPHCKAERMLSEDGKYGWCDACRRRSPIPVANQQIALHVETAHEVDSIIERLDRQHTATIAKLQEASNRMGSDVAFLKSRRTFFCDVGKNLIANAVWAVGAVVVANLSKPQNINLYPG